MMPQNNKDFNNLFTRVGAYLAAKVRAGFDAERSPEGRPWKPLSPATVRRKGHRRILQDTGAAYRSIYYRVSGDRIWIGVKPKYMAYHARTRPFLPKTLTEEEKREIKRIFLDWLR